MKKNDKKGKKQSKKKTKNGMQKNAPPRPDYSMAPRKDMGEFELTNDDFPGHEITPDMISCDRVIFYRWIWFPDMFGGLSPRRCFCDFETTDQRPCVRLNNGWTCQAIGLNKIGANHQQRNNDENTLRI